jgi:hypothetical protein
MYVFTHIYGLNFPFDCISLSYTVTTFFLFLSNLKSAISYFTILPLLPFIILMADEFGEFYVVLKKF